MIRNPTEDERQRLDRDLAQGDDPERDRLDRELGSMRFSPQRRTRRTTAMRHAPSYKTNDPRGWGGDPSRGAALGRRTLKGDHGYAGKIIVKNVRLDSGGYDPNGTYFGIDAPLYWYASPDGEIDGILRGPQGILPVEAEIRKMYPLAKIQGPKGRPYKPIDSMARFEAGLKVAASLREHVPSRFLPLFDHLLNLAKHDAERGKWQAAGRLLKKADDMALDEGTGELFPRGHGGSPKRGTAHWKSAKWQLEVIRQPRSLGFQVIAAGRQAFGAPSKQGAVLFARTMEEGLKHGLSMGEAIGYAKKRVPLETTHGIYAAHSPHAPNALGSLAHKAATKVAKIFTKKR